MSKIDTPISPDEKVIRRILRVNHAGEHGAVSIYTAQLGRLGASRSDLGAWISRTVSHERAHRAAFLDAMLTRHATPCRALGVWSVGGWLLGRLTALLGRRGVMACTAAVERTVHNHLQDQIAFLTHHDPALAKLVTDIQQEELEHLAFAEANLPAHSVMAALLQPVIAACTKLLIALSTRGDSLRLKAALRAG